MRRLWEYDEPELDALLATLTAEEAEHLLYDWEEWGRPEQVWRPSDAILELYSCGRGWGKTRTGAEAARWVAEHPLEYFGHRDVAKWRGALVGRTAADVLGTMLYGPSGLMTVTPEHRRPVHIENKRLLIWPTGVQFLTFSAQEPDLLRGPTFAWAWADEMSHWPTSKDPERPDAWTNLQLALREPAAIGGPKVVATTTPLPTRHIKRLVDRARRGDRKVRVVFGSTFDNRANLAATFLDEVVGQYEGTRLGRQELEGALLEDNPASLWPDAEVFQRAEVDLGDIRPGESFEDAVRRQLDLELVVVAVDPAVAGKPGACETGIIVAGRARGRFFVLEDLSVSPDRFVGRHFETAWAAAAVQAARRWRAEGVIGERNNGGALVEANLRAFVESERQGGKPAPAVLYRSVWASENKRTRAEPVALLYERLRVWHVGDPRRFRALEHQCQAFDPRKPADQQPEPCDRMDALVWALTYLTGALEEGRWSVLSDDATWDTEP